MDWATVLLLGLAVAGAFVQSSIGFGMAVVNAPFIVVFDPTLMPVAMVVVSSTLPVVQLVQGPRDIDRRALTWALLARVVTTPLGVWAVRALPIDGIAVLLAPGALA